MDYLRKLGFTNEDIDTLNNNIPAEVVSRLEEFPVLVWTNINLLIDLGVLNYKECFIKFPHIFLENNSVFNKKFTKYDQKDLVEKLSKNISIIEKL